MADAVQDDLAKPLKGRGRRQTRGKAGAKGGSRLSLARLILAGLLLGAAGLGLYIALIDDPLGGEPHQLARIVPKSNAVPEERRRRAVKHASRHPPIQDPRGRPARGISSVSPASPWCGGRARAFRARW